jgi:hypothetical protein
LPRFIRMYARAGWFQGSVFFLIAGTNFSSQAVSYPSSKSLTELNSNHELPLVKEPGAFA